VYPLSYWTGLLPLPDIGRAAISKLLRLSRLKDIPIPMDVGNMFVVGTKDDSNPEISSKGR
jgi:hypothetical protein